MLSISNSLPISKSWSPQKFGGILVTVLHVNVEKHVSTPLLAWKHSNIVWKREVLVPKYR